MIASRKPLYNLSSRGTRVHPNELNIPNREQRIDGSPAMGHLAKHSGHAPAVYRCVTCGRPVEGAAMYCRGDLNAVALRP